MRYQTKLKYLLTIYVVVMIVLMLSIAVTPLLIQKGITITERFIIEEDMVESLLIIILMGISLLILKGFKTVLKGFKYRVDQAGIEKFRLTSRLSEAFSYIGSMNVEIDEIHSMLNRVEDFPRTSKEFKSLMKNLTAKIMTFTGSPWVLIRLIDRRLGRTITEHAETSQEGELPYSGISNRAILEGRHIDGIRTIGSSQHNLALKTVCIFPATPLSEKAVMLTTALVNQIELIYLLVHANSSGKQYLGFHPVEQAIQHRCT